MKTPFRGFSKEIQSETVYSILYNTPEASRKVLVVRCDPVVSVALQISLEQRQNLHIFAII